MDVLKSLTILFFVLGVLDSLVYGQENPSSFIPLSIDRPDVSNLPVTVSPGHYQLEIGIEYSQNATSKAYNIPNVIFRTGLSPSTELRLGSSFTNLPSGLFNYETRTSSAYVSIKQRIVNAKKWIPSIGIEPEINLIRIRSDKEPTLDHQMTYAMLVLFNNAFHEKIYLNYNVGWFHINSHEQRLLLSASLSFQHTHRLGYFLEAYTHRTWQERKNISFDGGFTYLIHPRLQVDLYCGRLWAMDSPIKYLGTGVGFRLDKGDMRHRSFKDIGIHH